MQHVLRMNELMGRRPAPTAWPMLGREIGFFLRRSAPLLAISVAALLALCGWDWSRARDGSVFISLALLVASVVTLPHALLVTLGLDAARWQLAQPAPKGARLAIRHPWQSVNPTGKAGVYTSIEGIN